MTRRTPRTKSATADKSAEGGIQQPVSPVNAPRTAPQLAKLARTTRYRLACRLGLDSQQPDFLELTAQEQGEILAELLAALDRRRG